MYAQCPACLTTFKVTPAQLTARGGVVRCGICSAVFHAEQRLLKMSPKAGAEAATRHDASSSQKHKRQNASKNRRRSGRRRVDKIRSIDEKLAQDTGIPTITELRGLSRSRSFWRPLFWGLGNLLLASLLAGQFVFFYHDELAAMPAWRPLVVEFCRYASCEIRPRRDLALIELLQTTIAPHPKYENALRIRTTLVNRASFPQACPWMEVSLTNNAGNVIARRSFTPAQYLEAPATDVLMPNVAATTLLDVTNPDGKAVGYEIRMVTP
jgi:predicted Zn finger-like uncharacterized protein